MLRPVIENIELGAGSEGGAGVVDFTWIVRHASYV